MITRRLATAAIVLLGACTKHEAPPARAAAAGEFHSDYFVFLSTDAGPPLVVPVDLNWSWSTPGRVEVELKAWRGTPAAWPMFYLKETRAAKPPARWPELEGTGAIGLARDGSSITVERADLGRIVITVPAPARGAVVSEPFEGGAIETSAAETHVEVDGQRRAGWLIHEHIAAPEGGEPSDERRFSHFHWVPLAGDRALYLLRAMGDGSRRATRWLDQDGAVTATVSTHLDLEETERTPEAESGRQAVPRAWSLAVPEWQVRFTIHQVSAHTGYGGPQPHGRALYRQALVEGTAGDGRPTHGMVELILAD